MLDIIVIILGFFIILFIIKVLIEILFSDQISFALDENLTPSFVEVYPTMKDFPSVGKLMNYYINNENGKYYRWDGKKYILFELMYINVDNESVKNGNNQLVSK